MKCEATTPAANVAARAVMAMGERTNMDASLPANGYYRAV
jgi:hypothetical protein